MFIKFIKYIIIIFWGGVNVFKSFFRVRFLNFVWCLLFRGFRGRVKFYVGDVGCRWVLVIVFYFKVFTKELRLILLRLRRLVLGKRMGFEGGVLC